MEGLFFLIYVFYYTNWNMHDKLILLLGYATAMTGNALMASHYLSEYQRKYGENSIEEEDYTKLQKAQTSIEDFKK